MRKSYVFIYDNTLGDRETVRDFIDKIPGILNWRSDAIPNAFYLVSELSAAELASLIAPLRKSETVAFLVCEITANKQGFMDEKTWKVINEKPLPGQVAI